ncbi:MAG: YkgJ family cysteine cluster protein [Methanobacteriota archaeon]
MKDYSDCVDIMLHNDFLCYYKCGKCCFFAQFDKQLKGPFYHKQENVNTILNLISKMIKKPVQEYAFYSKKEERWYLRVKVMKMPEDTWAAPFLSFSNPLGIDINNPRACVFLNSSSMTCDIYKYRPFMCKKYTCKYALVLGVLINNKMISKSKLLKEFTGRSLKNQYKLVIEEVNRIAS